MLRWSSSPCVTLALVLFTGVTLRSALGACRRAPAPSCGRWRFPTATALTAQTDDAEDPDGDLRSDAGRNRGATDERPALFDLDHVLAPEPPAPDQDETEPPRARRRPGGCDAGHAP